MTANPTVLPSKPCRRVTDEEIEHLHEFGWVKLTRFVDPERLRSMLDLAREKMGEDADSNPISPVLTAAVDEGKPGLGYFNAQRGAGISDPVLRPLIFEVGRSAKLLQRRASADGSGVDARYYSDFFVPKLPSGKASRHGGNGPTAYHQDFITFAADRSGGMTFWIPLEPCGPAAGTMSFVSGSHREGVLGDYTCYGDGDALDVFPELRQLDMSDRMTYELGDITVHTHLTIHGAGPNLTDHPRWAYILVTQPADACWNGSPCPNFDHSAMTPWQQFGGDRFPIIS
ncbi:phytanoyl-CoA dioxygenase family protein [Pseudofrankia asymbiotica]|uniref:Phytanoyl-CoA dioxygenase n=1 Tax=Pseudofrankia asymbiotica TaxID=1834516 RepID=A0A1V2I8R0_9ACTN|nr:phytanoyl-CoA dioxygenase family protein [Pseudofrankia asymbiotica]ONH27157.1 phytanoyl-CoA dioxygenase [Pseudofrankia asymbiotica]